MSVVRLLLAYDGTDFHGWAAQPGVRTVQGAIEGALPALLGSRAKLSVAGRTDAGVHAQGQVASFVAAEGADPEQVQRMLNALFAPEVVVREARLAPNGFDARHSATAREYVYRIDTGPVPDPFTARFVWHRPGSIAIGPMRSAARHLLGERDFASFCRSPKAPSGTVRNLRRLTVRAEGDVVEIGAEANAFLHQMVRSLVGTLVRVGDGKLRPEEIPSILEARSRAAAGQIAPSRGLTLIRVRYGRRHPA